jgi:hypothetical protein
MVVKTQKIALKKSFIPFTNFFNFLFSCIFSPPWFGFKELWWFHFLIARVLPGAFSIFSSKFTFSFEIWVAGIFYFQFHPSNFYIANIIKFVNRV